MITFSDWIISNPCGEVIARQYDNLTRTLTVTGDIPEGWAIVPDGIVIPDTFPFVNIAAAWEVYTE